MGVDPLSPGGPSYGIPIKEYYEAFPSRKEAGAFTPLRSAAGGTTRPGIFAGFPDATTNMTMRPKRASPVRHHQAASCRARDKPRIDSASVTRRCFGYRLPRPREGVGGCQPVLKHGP